VSACPGGNQENHMSLETENDRLTAENVSLRDHLDGLTRSEAAKYRRVDCLRIAQKHLEGTRNIGDSILGTAANLAHFVENGVAGEPAKLFTA
jgi:hypothetical protein